MGAKGRPDHGPIVLRLSLRPEDDPKLFAALAVVKSAHRRNQRLWNLASVGLFAETMGPVAGAQGARDPGANTQRNPGPELDSGHPLSLPEEDLRDFFGGRTGL